MLTISDGQLIPNHRDWAALIRIRAKYRCERCSSTTRIQAHHVDRNKKNNRLSNGELLCGRCHFIEHHGGKKSSLQKRKRMSEGQRARRKREGKPVPRKQKRVQCPSCSLVTTPGPLKYHRNKLGH